MPVIDSTEGEPNADRLLQYWAGKIRSMGAEEIAGVKKVCTSPRNDTWDIELEVYVDQKSKAFRDFMDRL